MMMMMMLIMTSDGEVEDDDDDDEKKSRRRGKNNCSANKPHFSFRIHCCVKRLANTHGGFLIETN